MKKYQQHGGVDSFTFVYTSDRIDACDVRMYTNKSSEVCTLRFGNSFTLPVVTPHDLLMLAQEIETFAKRAHDFHYPELAAANDSEFPFDLSDETVRVAYEDLRRISRASVRGMDKVPTEPYVPVEQEQSKVERLMLGTVSAPEWDPCDPTNW